MRRREPDDALAGRGQRCERRHHDLQLADASKAPENLGQRPARPTPAWELMIERAVSRGYHAGGPGECRAAPDRMLLENLFKSGHDEAAQDEEIVDEKVSVLDQLKFRNMAVGAHVEQRHHAGSDSAPAVETCEPLALHPARLPVPRAETKKPELFRDRAFSCWMGL